MERGTTGQSDNATFGKNYEVSGKKRGEMREQTDEVRQSFTHLLVYGFVDLFI